MNSERSLFGVLAHQRRFVYLAVAVLSGAGIWSAFRLPSAIYPELTFSSVTVVVQGSALGARQVMFSITQPIATNLSSFKYLLAYFLAMSAAGAAFIAFQRRQAQTIDRANRELATVNRRMQQELSAAAQVQEALLPEVEERLRATLKAMDPEAMLKTWLPATLKGFEQLQEMFLSQMAGLGKKK